MAPRELYAIAEDAAIAITRFDAEMGGEIAPFSSVLLRSESAASSRIENLTASSKAIALAELGDSRGHNASLIVSNTSAMSAAIDLADQLDTDSIIAMHEVLLGSTHPDWVGHWRDQQVWIGGRDSPHSAMFVPPVHERVGELMDDLVAFMARNDLSVLVQAAIAHSQFETIRPFPDGNGRVGRAIVHSLLRGKGLTRNVTVPVSAGLLTDTESYFAALNVYRDGDLVPIVERMADASFSAITNGRALVEDLRRIRGEWAEKVRSRGYSSPLRLLDVLIRQPIIDSATAMAELGVAESNTFVAIARLVDAGVLKEISGASRNRRWQATEVLNALDDFARRSLRRG